MSSVLNHVPGRSGVSSLRAAHLLSLLKVWLRSWKVNSGLVLVYECVLTYPIAACRKVVTVVLLPSNTTQELRIPAIHPYDVECGFGA